jgi:hypothetical protein
MDMTHLFVPQTFARSRSQLVCAGVQLGVFEALSPEPRPSEVLGRRLATDPMMLELLLRALARFGLVREAHEGFMATVAARSLRSGDASVPAGARRPGRIAGRTFGVARPCQDRAPRPRRRGGRDMTNSAGVYAIGKRSLPT